MTEIKRLTNNVISRLKLANKKAGGYCEVNGCECSALEGSRGNHILRYLTKEAIA